MSTRSTLYGAISFAAALVLSVTTYANAAHAAPTPAASRGATGANLPYRGGNVMHHPTIYPIFWLPDGYHFHPAGGANSDKDYEDLMVQFLSDLSGSALYAGLTAQYSDHHGAISSSFDTADGYLDTRPFPRGRGSEGNPLLNTDVRAEIQHVVQVGQLENPPGEALFLLYLPYDVQQCSVSSTSTGPAPDCTYRPGHKGHCGTHSWFRKHGVTYLYATIADLSTACHSVERSLTDDSAPNGDALGDIAVNVTSHEVFEAITDPFFNAWAASNTDEIGDKCSSEFGTVADDGGDIVLSGDAYLLQMEWSNAQHGCVL